MTARDTARAVAALAVLAASIAFLARSCAPGRPPLPQAYFTADDGKTWFAASLAHVPPFEHEGREAVRAFVFACDGGRTRFVAYLQKYTPEARAALERATASLADLRLAQDLAGMGGEQLKRPGDTEWIAAGDERADAIRKPRCPHGTHADVAPVLP